MRVGTLVLAAFLVFIGGCATVPDPADPEAVAEFNAINDPTEPANRAVFAVNRGHDAAFLKPVAMAYRDMTPQFFQDRINDALDNLRAPVILFNDVLRPYVVLPLFGPSNPRDAIGMVVDFLIDPFNTWAGNTDRNYAVYSRSAARAVDLRATHLETLNELEKSSLDFYASIRSLYRQRRINEISNGDPSANWPAPGIGQGPYRETKLKTQEAFRTQ